MRLTREMGDFENLMHGFVVDISDKFIVLQEVAEFEALGYAIIPIDTITQVRYNAHDATVDRILSEEGSMMDVKKAYDIDITSWQSLCEDLRKTGLTVISECERSKRRYFCIGEIQEAGKNRLSIRYFNAEGILDKKNTKHKYKWITKLRFDDRYANVFSKYVREA